MANTKATKQEIQFPPLINLQEDRPHVASDFRSVEKLNAPYLNGMISPLWIKTEDYESRPVWDLYNNKYEIIDGHLYKNDEKLFSVDNKKFVRTDVTDELDKYLSFDVDADDNLATLYFDDDDNTVTLEYKGLSVIHPNLYVEGVILASRARIINNNPVAIVIYKVNSTISCLYLSNTRNEILPVTFYNYYAKTATANTFLSRRFEVTVDNLNPLIQICNPYEDAIGITIFSNSGLLFTRESGICTFIDYNDKIIDNPTAVNGSVTETIDNYNYYNFEFSGWDKTEQYSTNYYVYNKDGDWYYEDGTEVTDLLGIFSPRESGRTIVVDGTEYSLYGIEKWTNTKNFKIIPESDKEFNYEVALADEIITSTDTDFTYTIESWSPVSIVVHYAKITLDDDSFTTSDFQNEFTIAIRGEPTVTTLPYIIAPNAFLDNGKMYAFYTVPEAGTTSSSMPITMPTNTLIAESGIINAITDNEINFDIVEAHVVNNLTPVMRSNSITVGQNFISSSTKFSTSNTRTPYQLYVSGNTENTIGASCKYTEYSNSNVTDMIYYAGTYPNNKQKFYTFATDNSEDVAWYHAGGYRTSVENSNFKINYSLTVNGTLEIQSISYAKDDDSIGTNLVGVGTVSNSAIVASDNTLYYKDLNNKWIRITIEDGAELSQFENKYIFINTTSYWNFYDVEANKKYHYATDYNDRMIFGQTRQEYRDTYTTVYTYSDRRVYLSAINSNYSLAPNYVISSILPVPIAYNHLLNTDAIIPNLHFYQSKSFESRDIQPIDVYLQLLKSGSNNYTYITSVDVFTSYLFFKEKQKLNTTYTNLTYVLYPTTLLSKFINGAGNNDFVDEYITKYPLVYNNKNKAIFLYNYLSGTNIVDIKYFFCIQGQYYAIIGNKLYSMIYSNGLVSQQDAIIDLGELQFMGNTPSIAFFLNPSSRQFYSFSGDANLQLVFDAQKFKYDFSNTLHFYDASTQSIYIVTNLGLLVFGPENTYVLDDFTDVQDIEFTKGVIHIVNDKVNNLMYLHDDEDYETLPIRMETSFWGLAGNEVTTIDRWAITLYDSEMREQDVKLKVRSLTDITVKSEEKTLHINSNDWDKWSHSVFINYNPALIKGQGIRLSIETISSIQKIVPHVTDQKNTTTTNSRFEV